MYENRDSLITIDSSQRDFGYFSNLLKPNKKSVVSNDVVVGDAGYVIILQDDNSVVLGRSDDGGIHLPGGKSLQYPVAQSLVDVLSYIKQGNQKTVSKDLYDLLVSTQDTSTIIKLLQGSEGLSKEYVKFLSYYPKQLTKLSHILLRQGTTTFGEFWRQLFGSNFRYVVWSIKNLCVESPLETAMRECYEETSYFTIQENLRKLCYIDIVKGDFVKRCHYFVHQGNVEQHNNTRLTWVEQRNGLTTSLYDYDDAIKLFEKAIDARIKKGSYSRLSMMIAHLSALKKSRDRL